MSEPATETSAEDRRPAWKSWGVGAQPAGDGIYPPTSAWTEPALIAAYANTAGLDQPELRTERCACGGRIRSVATDRAIAYAVGLHNRGVTHERWAIAQGMR